MIGDPVALTVRRNPARPTAALVKAFDAPTGFVTDSFNGQGCLDYRIKPMLPLKKRIVGPALTCFCGPTDLLAAMASLDFAKKGDVIVVNAQGATNAAVVGDRWAYWARKIGVAAVVVDGLVRDLAGLREVGLPIFARGLCPNSGFKNGPGEINTRISCGGIAIDPGDIVVGDEDGVVVVPQAQAADVARQLALVAAKEAELDAQLRKAKTKSFWDEAATQARGGVRYLD